MLGLQHMWNFIRGIHYTTFQTPANKYFHLSSWSGGLVEKLHDFRDVLEGCNTRSATRAQVNLALLVWLVRKSELQVHNKDESKPSSAVTPASVKGVAGF